MDLIRLVVENCQMLQYLFIAILCVIISRVYKPFIWTLLRGSNMTCGWLLAQPVLSLRSLCDTEQLLCLFLHYKPIYWLGSLDLKSLSVTPIDRLFNLFIKKPVLKRSAIKPLLYQIFLQVLIVLVMTFVDTLVPIVEAGQAVVVREDQRVAATTFEC